MERSRSKNINECLRAVECSERLAATIREHHTPRMRGLAYAGCGALDRALDAEVSLAYFKVSPKFNISYSNKLITILTREHVFLAEPAREISFK